MTKTNIINEKDFNFGYPFYYLEEDFEFFETKIDDYWYVLDMSGKTYFKTKLEIQRLTTDDILFKDPKTKLCGTLDNFGNLKIKPEYEYLINIVEHSIHNYGLLSYCINSKWGLMDTNGKVIAEPKFDSYFELIENIKDKNYYITAMDKNWGVVNNMGNIILPFEYAEYSIYAFNQNSFIATKISSGKTGVVDCNNKTIIPFVYDWIREEIKIGKFKGCLIACKNNKAGIINLKNEIVVPFICDDIGIISDKTLVVEIGELKYIVDDSFNKITGRGYHDFYGYSSFNDDILVSIEEDDKYGLIDRFDNIKIDFKYKDLTPFETALDKQCFKAQNQDGLWGVIDEDENILVPFKIRQWETINCMNSDFTYTEKRNNKEGLLDKNGKILIDFKFDKIDPFYNLKTAFAKLKGKTGLIDKQGNSISFNLDNTKEIKL